MSPAGADLSRDAIEARRLAKVKTGRAGGWTGAELIDVAAATFREAKHLAKLANKRVRPARARRASDKADEALRQAATQIRLAERIPLDGGYLHHLTVRQIDRVKAEVGQAFDNDDAALAVDTHRRIQQQRARRKRAGAG